MSKYKTYNGKRFRSGYFVFSIVIICIIGLSIGYSYYSDTLTISGSANAKYAAYTIEYVLNGGINPENVITTYSGADEIPLPVPTKNNYVFDGWYDNEQFIGLKKRNTSDLEGNTILFARWKAGIVREEEYFHEGEYVFTGSNYIDTGVYLYTNENVKRNFIISFDIIEVADSNVNHSALMNSMDESKSPWNGNVVKVSDTKTIRSVKFESNSNTNTSGDVYIPSTVKNVRTVRINDKLYYSFDGAKFTKINDYTGFTGTFEVPVTFGASMDGNKNPYRYFTGTLANMSVAFLNDNITIKDLEKENEEDEEFEEVIVYANAGPVVMDGDDYIDTGLYLFNKDNFYKDFEISFTIDSVDAGQVQQATIVNMKDEKQNPAPGFVYRIYQSTDNTVKFEAKLGKGSGASNKIPDVHDVKITRSDSKMYLTINDGTPKLVYDYTDFNKFFDVPLTIGGSLDWNGEPFRGFKGTLSNIQVTVTEVKQKN